MYYKLSKTHQLLRQMLRQFAQNEIRPIAAELDREEHYPYETLKKFFENGFMGFHLAPELGGSGGDHLGYVLTMEEFAKVDTPTAGILSGHNEATIAAIAKWGTKKQKETYLPQLLREGRKLGGFSMTEPTAGSDSNGVRTTAIRQGNYYLVNGTKCFATNGGTAEIFILVAVTDPAIHGSKGKSAFILDVHTPGVTIGKKEKMMGFREASICEIILNNVKIPIDNILGQEGDGLKVALGGLEGGRVDVAGEAIGNAQGMLDEVKKFINSTTWNGKLLARYQNVQFKFAEMQTQVDCARLLTYNAASMMDEGLPCNLEASQAKYFATKTANDIASACIDLLGQFGYTDRYIGEKFMRDAKLLEIYEGTNEVQKIVISRGMGLKTRKPRKSEEKKESVHA
ncbi:acyl-CoA dehydrogenase family protein [Sporolactobacillus sp. CQH2019]|uniref:acyl-CoA dehydrogenase family protein n=1 Tax=Sporolactobacillus sp. CQH2019 TaxID=3023512 RepID=UPI00236778C3|nr:acyl-CoA dehydrogenase family protein [Sporolactobacillus sp. CQH2019]MDD9149190.1 acyl-CoA dehydrogenase family protein [Sporolactobacillus sp. CQH2019]